MPLRIMATADVHLGMKFASYRALQSELVEARFDALTRVVKAANDRECQLLVVAGDLFHRVGVAAGVVRRATEILREFSGSAVAVLPGNHDYISTEGDRLWSLFRDTAGDRTLVLDSAEFYDMRVYDLNVVLLAAPCDSLHGHEHRVGWTREFVAPSGDLTTVGVAHGSIDGLTLDAEGKYFPMSRKLLGSLPPIVWIVGHTHRQHDLPGARLVVPGTPEPDGFDYPYPGRAAFITIEGDRCSAEPVLTGTHIFADISIDLDRARPMADQLDQAVPADALVRLALSGTLDRAGSDDLRLALQALEARLPYLRVDDSEVRRLVTQSDVDAAYAGSSFAHSLVTALLDDEDADGAAAAVELLSAIEAHTTDAGDSE